ncbi:MAG TPA: hypothetical protein IAC41_05215 [Candidatus Merdenecus merdavium]|nr:hypothetical protein [Candidatus Merdenecus merdavium]
MNFLKKGLDGFTIKVLALIFMTIDHTVQYLIPMNPRNKIMMIFIILGRISAPLFLFMATQGLIHTKSKYKYVLRLYVAAVICSIFNSIFSHIFLPSSSYIGNMIFTFFYLGIVVLILENIRTYFKNKNLRVLIITAFLLLFIVVSSLWPWIFYERYYDYIPENMMNIIVIVQKTFIPSILKVDYTVFFVLLGVIWYYIDNSKINSIIFFIFSIINILLQGKLPGSPYIDLGSLSNVTLQHYMIFATPFIYLYNGKKGRSFKYFFYIYYPLHQYLLFLIGIFFLNKTY